jgi:hypothetical protein
MSIVIAVDGTAASGKGTLAKKLARHYGFAHLDSGALYRLTAFSVLQMGGDPKNETDALRGAQTMDFNLAGDPCIRTDVVGQAASYVAAIPAVRAALFDFQRDFVTHRAGRQSRRGDGWARHRYRDLPRGDGQTLYRRPARHSGPPPLGGTEKHGNCTRRAGIA